MKDKIRNVPWGKKKDESRIVSFNRQATKTAQRDQQRLIGLGWKPMEAAVEAWLTMKAGS